MQILQDRDYLGSIELSEGFLQPSKLLNQLEQLSASHILHHDVERPCVLLNSFDVYLQKIITKKYLTMNG